jgi:hypothetical protein
MAWACNALQDYGEGSSPVGERNIQRLLLR